MTAPYIAEIRVFAGNFAPRGYALCNGQLLPISQNAALFSLIGTFYGGNGTTTFALPNFQGSVPIHAGQGPGLSDYVLGEVTGTETVTVLNSQMTAHTHRAQAVAASGQSPTPVANLWAQARVGRGAVKMYSDVLSPVAMNPVAVIPTGGGQPHNNIPPVLALTFIIATQGIFPSRN
jgi:microcystin-dependent protein